MNLSTFEQSLQDEAPPSGLTPELMALWWDAKGHWDRAHQIVQDLASPEAAWIHALLHREEGDQRNADYWYRRAARQRPSTALHQEWQDIASTLLDSLTRPDA